MKTESKRDKDRTKEESNSSSSDSNSYPAGTMSNNSQDAATATTTSSRCLPPSSGMVSVEPDTLASSMHAAQSLSPSHANAPLPSSKRTGVGLVGVARARGWLRSYHPSSSSPSQVSAAQLFNDDNGIRDSCGSGTNPPISIVSSSSPTIVSSTSVDPTSSSLQSPSNHAPNALPSQSNCTSSSTSLSSTTLISSSSSSSVACISPSFAASLNAALASGPLTPTGGVAAANPFNPNHQQQQQHYDSSSAPYLAGTNTRGNNMPPGLAPGLGLLSALVGSGSGATSTQPTALRPTGGASSTGPSYTSSSSSSTPTTTISPSTSASTPSSSTSSATTVAAMSSAYSHVVTSIAQRNSQQQQQQSWNRQRTY